MHLPVVGIGKKKRLAINKEEHRGVKRVRESQKHRAVRVEEAGSRKKDRPMLPHWVGDENPNPTAGNRKKDPLP